MRSLTLITGDAGHRQSGLANFIQGTLMRTAIALTVATLVAGLFVPTAKAVQLNVTAVYSPDKANPAHNKFVNTTPISGHCYHYPASCPGMFSIELPVTFETQADIKPVTVEPDPHKGPYFRMPSTFRTVTVTHEKTGATAELKFRVSGIGGTYRVQFPPPLPRHRDMWDLVWVAAKKPCESALIGYYTPTDYSWFWTIPAVDGACIKKPQITIPPPFRYFGVSFAYELITPDPLTMDIGRYRGSLTLGVGPYQDFDFGQMMVPSDNLVTLNFDLAVNHLLKVDFPPGSDRAVLQPSEGWRAWMNTGKNPPALAAQQQFNLSSSGKFRMYLECEYDLAGTCAIQEPSGQSKVPVDISVTLPHGVVGRSSQKPVQRQKLLIGSNNAEEFQTRMVQFDRKATLHYDVAASGTAQMTAYAGQTYRGVATVVFDASF